MMFLVKKPTQELTHDAFTTLAAALLKHPARWASQTRVAMIANARETDYRTEREWTILLDALEEKLTTICNLRY